MIFTAMLVFLRRRVTPAHFSAQNLCRLLVLVCWAAISPLGASDVAKVKFDVPAGGADKTLKVFAKQAQREIIFPVKPLAGVKTNTVQGEYSVTEALERLLAGTELTVREDEKTGGLIIRRRDDPNAPRAALNAASVHPPANPSLKDETVVLSPFEVTSSKEGYYATNTTSGTRLNSRIEDLGASITVITKEQMADFAMLDINDIFNYEAGTEGTGNFTDSSIDQNGQQIDNTQLDPQSANRIRGVGSANTTRGNFETSGRVPIDPTEVDGVEISRGPNSSIFGVGQPSGTVNSIPTSANLFKHTSQITFRADSNDGYRSTLDVNRVLKNGVLAVRGTTVFQHDGFHLKPSGTDTRRLAGMIKYRPFKATALAASYSHYRMHGNRPNVSIPAQAITGWTEYGSPTWDPITSTMKIEGVPAGNASTYLATSSSSSYSQVYVDRNGIAYWGTGAIASSTNPNVVNANVALRIPRADPSGFLVAQPLYPDYPVSTNKAVYDWSRINLAATNRVEDSAQTASVVVEQYLLDSPRQMLAVQLAWFRELTERQTFNPIGSSTGAASLSQFLQIDPNERLLDGSPNPYFQRPFIGAFIPNRFSLPSDRDTFRAQLGYKWKGDKQRWHRWLGEHQFSGYVEYKEVSTRSFQYRDSIIDQNHSWPGRRDAIAGAYFRYYVGDAGAPGVQYAPTAHSYGSYTMRWVNGVTREVVNEPVQLGLRADNTAGAGNSLTVLKTRGGMVQSMFADGRVVTTFGLRFDERYTKGPNRMVLLPDGINVDWPASNGWLQGDWYAAKGPTRTAGIVLKPFPWLNFFANRSDSFQPAGVGLGMQFQVLPDPSGKGQDAGIALNFFQGRLNLRLNVYKTTNVNSRNGPSGTFGTRTYRLDYSGASSLVFALQRKATEWVQAAAAASGTTLSGTELNQRIAAIMQVPVETLTEPAYIVTAADDIIAKGTELEVNYSPTANWTMKFNATEQESINSSLSKDIATYLEKRMPIWGSIIDPLIGRPWFTERYNNANSAQQYLTSDVTVPLSLARAMEGKSRPQIRKYRLNFLTNYSFKGWADNALIKRFNIGGALRWEDKGAIGYYGLQQPPKIVTALDPSRPVYDKSHIYADLILGYRMHIFGERIRTMLQLNVRNVNESGRLQPIAADPSGGPTGYRIIDPRLVILTASFEL